MSMTQNIQIVFEFATRHGTFRDALYLPTDHGLTDEQIAEMQRERLNNWLAIVEAPPVDVPLVEDAPIEEAPSDA
jgi:hypothetical protein